MTPWFEQDGQNPFHKATLKPGQYYPRIARPIDQHPHESPGWSPGAIKEANVIAVAQSQLSVLTQQLEKVCQTIQPTERTLDVFGHDIRNLLILACTEVESHWRGVLVANGLQKTTFSTKDYVLLRKAMKLEDYAITFPAYPWLNAIAPFKGWDSTAPTGTLKWYDAYNAVKHNRDDEFERATLAPRLRSRHRLRRPDDGAIRYLACRNTPGGLAIVLPHVGASSLGTFRRLHLSV